MSSKHRKKKNQSQQNQQDTLLTDQAASQEKKPSEAAEMPELKIDEATANPETEPAAVQPEQKEAASEQSASDAEKSAEQKSGAKVVVPARIKVKTDRDGNLIETPPAGANADGKKQGDAPRRSAEPVQTVKPADIKKPQVSFMNSIANVEAESLSQRGSGATSQAYDHAVLVSDSEENSSYRPKIRRMSDSTRAKELRRRQSSDSQPYEKVTPVSTPQTLPASKLRKRKEQAVSPEVLERIPDNLKQHPLEKAKPVRYMKQAEHTKINLSTDSDDARKKNQY